MSKFSYFHVIAHGVLFVKYASILLQAITLQVDEAFLYAVLDLTKLDGVEWEVDSEKCVYSSTYFMKQILISMTVYLFSIQIMYRIQFLSNPARVYILNF